MCMICQKPDDFSLEHMEQELKKIRKDRLESVAKEIKDSITKYEMMIKLHRGDGFEKEAMSGTLEYFRKAQYLLGRYM